MKVLLIALAISPVVFVFVYAALLVLLMSLPCRHRWTFADRKEDGSIALRCSRCRAWRM